MFSLYNGGDSFNVSWSASVNALSVIRSLCYIYHHKCGALRLEDVLHVQYFTFITAEVHLHFQCVSCLKLINISKKLD